MSEKDMKEAKDSPCLVCMLYTQFTQNRSCVRSSKGGIAGIKAEAALHKGHIRLLSCTRSHGNSQTHLEGLAHLP